MFEKFEKFQVSIKEVKALQGSGCCMTYHCHGTSLCFAYGCGCNWESCHTNSPACGGTGSGGGGTNNPVDQSEGEP